MNNINYVNAIIREINDLTDSIYEDLSDEDYKSMNKNIQELIRLLKYILKTHNNK